MVTDLYNHTYVPYAPNPHICPGCGRCKDCGRPTWTGTNSASSATSGLPNVQVWN